MTKEDPRRHKPTRKKRYGSLTCEANKNDNPASAAGFWSALMLLASIGAFVYLGALAWMIQTAISQGSATLTRDWLEPSELALILVVMGVFFVNVFVELWGLSRK